MSLYQCVDQAIRFIHARGRNRDLCLLDIPNHVCEAMEFEVYQGVVVAHAIVQLHFGGNLRDTIGLTDGSMVVDLDLLIGDFNAAVNVVLGVVSVEEIIHDLP